MTQDITRLLPGANCNKCAYRRCELFAEALASGNTSLAACPLLKQERYKQNFDQILSLLKTGQNKEKTDEFFVGLIDNYRADYILHPLPGEPACRETLVSFSNISVDQGDTVRYRPLGCPIMHIAEVHSSELGMITVYVKGPRRTETPYDTIINLGTCLVAGFTGILQGGAFDIGDTIRFIPGLCMMQKVHSGIVVQADGNKVSIELIDLKVWEPPVKHLNSQTGPGSQD